MDEVNVRICQKEREQKKKKEKNFTYNKLDSFKRKTSSQQEKKS